MSVLPTALLRPHRGFALIVALALMTFVVLLLLSLSAIIQVEVTSTQQYDLFHKARQNALAGLYIALGEVQQSLGPDQRITAVATIKDTVPDDADDWDETDGQWVTDGIIPERQQWTGVWATERGTDGTVTVSFRNWLVSGFAKSHTPAQDDVYTGAAAFEDPVSMLPGKPTVEAGKVTIDNNDGLVGAYAYWVEDEGTKARADLRSDHAADATFPGQYGTRAMRDLGWFPTTSTSARQVYNFPGFQLLAKDTGGSDAAAKSRNHIHDLTFHSYGVLANTADGGLRTDLTTALYDSAGSAGGAIFPTADGNAADAEDRGGPLWEQLRSWVANRPDAQGALLIRPSTASQAGLHPVLAGGQIYVVPTYTLNEGQTKATIVYNIFPAVILWNPYNVPIQSADYTISFARTLINGTGFDELSSYWNQLWKSITVASPGSDDTDTFTLPGGIYHEPANFFLSSGQLQPGEAVVYSPPIGFQTYDVGNPQPDSATLQRGYRPGYAGFQFHTPFEIDVPRKADGTPDTAFEGRLNTANSRVLSMRLWLGSGASAQTLQDAVYLNNGPISDYSEALHPLEPSPGEEGLVDLSYASGTKSILVYSENEGFWNANAALPPESWKWLSQHNPRARLLGPVPFVFEKFSTNAVSQNPSYATNTSRAGSRMPVAFSDISNLVDVGIIGNNRTILFQVAPPRDALHSIAQLSHAPLFNDEGDLEERVRNARFGNLIPAYAIGNGRADPLIPLDKLERDWDGAYTTSQPQFFTFKGIHHDYVYKLNDALWDQWFFSTLPAGSASSTPANPRLIAAATGGSSTDAPAAAKFLLSGAFNINSTSVEAWKALFASFYQADVNRSDNTTDSHSPTTPHSPLLRMDTPAGGPVSDAASWTDTEQYDGYRRLNSGQIEELASAIVEEVKLRGPFGSLAQFINRMPTKDGTFSEAKDAFRLKGALTAAIDKTSINDSLRQTALQSNNPLTQLNAQADGWRSEDLPGWLSQVDILTRLGSTLSARSDTFRIRIYGEALNPASNEIATARCEAIVQRLPEFINHGENAADAAKDDLSVTNRTLGRRFIITHFRWLGDNDL